MSSTTPGSDPDRPHDADPADGDVPADAPSPDEAAEPSTPEPAVVLPLSRTGVRPEPPTRPLTPRTGGLERLLRTASARGAEALPLRHHRRG